MDSTDRRERQYTIPLCPARLLTSLKIEFFVSFTVPGLGAAFSPVSAEHHSAFDVKHEGHVHLPYLRLGDGDGAPPPIGVSAK